MKIKPLGWVLIVIALFACIAGGYFALQYINAPKVPPAQPQATNPPVAVANTATPQAPGTSPTKAPPQPTAAEAPTVAPTQGPRETLTVAFDSFGSYFAAIQVYQQEKRDYDLKLVPLAFGGVDYSEAQRAQKLVTGEWDALLMTSNAFARNGNIGKIVAVVDQSAGADKIVAWPTAVTGTEARPIEKFNDLQGLTIAYSKGSVGEFQLLALLRVVGLTPQDVVLMPLSSVPDAVEAFKNKQADAVAGWEPNILEAIDAGGKELVSSDWWRNIADVIIVSNNADQNKQAAVQAFLRDWFLALKAEQEDLGAASDAIAAWQHEGQPTNDWTYVYEGSAKADMELWLGTIAQAGLPANAIVMNNKDLLVQQLLSARDVWAWGGQLDLTQQFDPNEAIATNYIATLSKDPALKSTGAFVNNTFQPVAPEVPAADPNVLITLPAFAELPCKSFEFLPNSPALDPASLPVLQTCATAAIDLLRVSDAQILVSGWSAWPTGYTEDEIREFARQRAIGVQTALVQMGVDPARIAIVAEIPPPEDQNATNDAQLAPYRKVVIEIKRGGR